MRIRNFVFLSGFLIFIYLFVVISNNNISPELNLASYSLFSKKGGKFVAASCGFSDPPLNWNPIPGSGVGHSDESYTCWVPCGGGVSLFGTSQCGGTCQPEEYAPSVQCVTTTPLPSHWQKTIFIDWGPSQPAYYCGMWCSGPTANINSNDVCVPTCPNCANGANNAPYCDTCSAGSTWNGSSCACNNNAVNAPLCNLCAAGQIMYNSVCTCSNGATNPPSCNACPAGSTLTAGSCVCNNNADIFQQCNVCRAGQVFNGSGVCVDSCVTNNVCGQNINGYLSGGICLPLGSLDINSSCIATLTMTTDTINPNGSVEFSWSLSGLPANVGSECGFVDLTYPVARPIPGLQNLDSTVDRARITNIQSTTRFCLVCRFYDLLNGNALLGEAAKHQWIKVQRIGEN